VTWICLTVKAAGTSPRRFDVFVHHSQTPRIFMFYHKPPRPVASRVSVAVSALSEPREGACPRADLTVRRVNVNFMDTGCERLEHGTMYDQRQLSSLAEEYECRSAQDILRGAFERAPNITFACSFGAEDMVLLDMIMKIRPETHVFYLDTDVLFSETYQLIEQSVARYGIAHLIRVKSDLTLAEQAMHHGEELWKRDPNLCCNLRKVQPLKRTLSGYDAWITGIRREQTPMRKHAKPVEWDAKFHLLKVNPLVRWSHEDVWTYLHAHGVPYNPLHDVGYPSIGCRHCTAPVTSGDNPRSGRWAGFEKIECGLHK
jgi:phosphoadenosine phosphosulfate reductase